MIGRCRHQAFRFRIVLLLFTFMLIYSTLWIFNFQIISYNQVTKTVVKSDLLLSRRTLSRSAKDQTHSEQKLMSDNGTENTAHPDQQRSNDTSLINETVRSKSFAAINKTDFKRTKDKENKTEIETIAPQGKEDQYKSLISHTKDYIDGHAKLLEHQNSENVSDSKHRSIAVHYTTKHIQAHKNGSNASKTRENTNKPQHLRNTTRSQGSGNMLIDPDRLRSNKEQYYKLEIPISSIKETVSLGEKSPSLIQMNLKGTLDDEPGNSKEIGSTFMDIKADTFNKSVTLEPKMKMLNLSNTDLSSKEKLGKAVNNNSKSSNENVSTTTTSYTFSTCKLPLNKTNKTKIGILIPSSTRKIQNPILENLTLVNLSLPSIYKTLDERYIYRIYIGIDEGDFLQTVQDRIMSMFECTIPVIVRGRNYVKSVNTIADRAYKDGMDYFVRINDDTIFNTTNWTYLAINKLLQYKPKNIGVVGPTCNEGNTLILTHDMVHRKHLEIFDFYYPPYLENWWTDDWITRIYEPYKSTKLQSWIVQHIIIETRYVVDKEREKWSKQLIEYDKTRLNKYFELSYSCSCALKIYLSVLVVLTWLICLVINTL